MSWVCNFSHWHCPCFFLDWVEVGNVIDISCILVLHFSARGTPQLLLSMTDYCEMRFDVCASPQHSKVNKPYKFTEIKNSPAAHGGRRLPMGGFTHLRQHIRRAKNGVCLGGQMYAIYAIAHGFGYAFLRLWHTDRTFVGNIYMYRDLEGHLGS